MKKKLSVCYIPYLKVELVIFVFTELKNIVEYLKYHFMELFRPIQRVVSPFDTLFINENMRNRFCKFTSW